MSVKNAASATIHLLLKNERPLHLHTVLRDLPCVIGQSFLRAIDSVPPLERCPYVFYNPETKTRWHDAGKP